LKVKHIQVKWVENLIQLVRRLIRSPVGKYSAVNGFAKFLPFIVSIVLASLMSPSEYGQIALVIVVSSVVGTLINYGYQVLIARESHVNNPREFSELMSSSWVVSAIMFALVISVVFLLDQSLSWIGLEYELLVCSVVLGFLLGRTDVFSKYLIAQQKIRDFSVLELCKGIVTALSSIILVYAFLEYAVLARITGLLVGAAIALLLAYYFVRKRVICLPPRIKYIRWIFIYGTKVLPQAAANWIKLGADKIVIGSLVGLDVLGAYSFTFTVCSLYMIFGKALNNAFIGPCISMYKRGDVKGVGNIRIRYIINATALVLICFVGVVLLPFVYWPDGYKASEMVVGLLMLSFLTQVVYLLYMKYFLFSLKMAELGALNVLAALAYVALLILGEAKTLEYVALCFCVYNLSLAFYVVLRVSYLEKTITIVDY